MKEALKLALEALEWINRVNAMDYEYQQKAREALNAIYEALAQPEQEPVAIELALAGLVEKITGGFDSGDLLADAVTASKMLDAQPKQPISVQPEQEPVAWMTLNEYGEEDDIHYENPEGHLMEGWTYKPLYTHPPTVQPEKEPLEYWNAVEGWVKIDEVREHFDSVGCGTIYKTAGEDRVPVYTTPPQRNPLRDNEIAKILDRERMKWHKSPPTYEFDLAFARAIEAAHGIKE